MSIAIVDCLLYAGLGAEDALVELRLHELDGVADHHVVVESRQDFQGHPKPLHFPHLLKRLGSFASRIHYTPIDLPETDVYPRAEGGRERYARNALVASLPAGGRQDAIVISDCDEIPRAEVLKHVATAGWVTYVQLGMIPYYMQMNLKVVSDIGQAPGDRKTWPGPVVVRRAVVEHEKPYDLRDVPGRRLVPHGGWHFSFLGTPAQNVAKLRAWGHSEFVDGVHDTEANFEVAHRTATDWDHTRAGGPLQLERVPVDESYPAFVREHPEKFRQYMGGE